LPYPSYLGEVGITLGESIDETNDFSRADEHDGYICLMI